MKGSVEERRGEKCLGNEAVKSGQRQVAAEFNSAYRSYDEGQ